MNDRLEFRVFYKNPFVGEKSQYFYIDKDNFNNDTDIIKEWVDQDDGDDFPIYYKKYGLLFADDEDFIIERSLGRKDKNGKLIFWGDLLKDKNGQIFTYKELEQDKQLFCFWQNVKFASCFPQDGYKLGYSDQLEVIGNIHENTELLGGK